MKKVLFLVCLIGSIAGIAYAQNIFMSMPPLPPCSTQDNDSTDCNYRETIINDEKQLSSDYMQYEQYKFQKLTTNATTTASAIQASVTTSSNTSTMTQTNASI